MHVFDTPALLERLPFRIASRGRPRALVHPPSPRRADIIHSVIKLCQATQHTTSHQAEARIGTYLSTPSRWGCRRIDHSAVSSTRPGRLRTSRPTIGRAPPEAPASFVGTRKCCWQQRHRQQRHRQHFHRWPHRPLPHRALVPAADTVLLRLVVMMATAVAAAAFCVVAVATVVEVAVAVAVAAQLTPLDVSPLA